MSARDAQGRRAYNGDDPGISVTIISSRVDFSDAAARVDPYPVYQRLRQTDPVYWDEAGRGWLISSRETANAVLARGREFRAGVQLGDFAARWPQAKNDANAVKRHLSAWPMVLDRPDHDRVRATLRRACALTAIRPARDLAPSLAATQLAAIGTGGFDVLHDLARPLAQGTLAAILCIAEEELEPALDWSDELLMFMNAPREIASVRAAAAVVRALEAWSVELCTRPELRSDSLPGVLRDALRGESISPCELGAIMAQIVTGTLGALAQFVAHALHRLAAAPGEMAALRGAAEQRRRAVEELLRLEPPFLLMPRQALEPVDVLGVRIRSGDAVRILIGAVNRDPAVVTDPECLQISRAERASHLTFGAGAHACPGAVLSRAVTSAALGAVLSVSGGFVAGTPTRLPLFGMRWMTSAPVARVR